MRVSARPFSRLQSTHKPSPSGEGISLWLVVFELGQVNVQDEDVSFDFGGLFTNS